MTNEQDSRPIANDNILVAGRAARKATVFYIIIVIILVIKIFGHFESFISFARFSNFSFFTTLPGIYGVPFYAGVASSILLLVIAIKHWGIHYRGKKISVGDLALVKIVFIIAIITLILSIVLSIMQLSFLGSRQPFGGTNQLRIIFSNVIGVLKQIAYIAVYILYFANMRKLRKSQKESESAQPSI